MTDKPPITAAPGIYLIRLLEQKTQVNVGSGKDKSILFGEIIDIGTNRSHDQGGKLEATYKVGDKIWFFSYLDNADVFKYEKQEYRTVLFNDARARLEK